MKTIGFIDYYLSEWHANNYPAWIQEICEQTGEDFCVKYAWAEEYVSPVDGRNTDEWCKEFGVEKCETLEELCKKADYLLILSPSNPEKHLAYAKEALKYGKNTYIDKTFAPDFATAKNIFHLGNQYNTKFFSTSALRFSTETDDLGDLCSVVTTGGGSNIEEYVIHQIEMVVKTLRARPLSVKTQQAGSSYSVLVRFDNEKSAMMHFGKAYPFSVHYERENGEYGYSRVSSDFFKRLLAEILHFYNTGILPFDEKQTLDVIKIRDGVIQSLANLDKEIIL